MTLTSINATINNQRLNADIVQVSKTMQLLKQSEEFRRGSWRRFLPLKANRYHELYAQAQEVLTRINPCEIQIINGRASCVETRNGGNGPQLCCHHCEHIEDACTIKSLACKLWLCWTVEQTPKGKTSKKELEHLERMAYEENIPMPFRSQPPAFVIL